MEKYLVKKQFAVDSNVYNEGDLLEMSAEDASAFIAEEKLNKYVEEKKMEVQLDTKGIIDAIAALAPKEVEAPEAKLGFGDFLQGIAKKNLDVKTINITTNTQGEYATTSYTDPSIDADLLRESGIASGASMTSLSGTNNIYKKNVINSTGAAPAVFAESATITASQPTVTQFSFTLEKVAFRMDITEEALEDTGALVSEINGVVPEQFSKFVEDGMINGSGTVLSAIVGDTNTVTVAKESGQTDSTIVVENIDKMLCSAKRPASSTWVMSRSAYCAVQGLEDSAGNRIFQGPNGVGPTVFGTLKGLPILVSDYCAVVGNVGDIILGDFSKYQLVSKGGLKLASSAHIKFLEDETVFKFTYRMAGKPVGLLLTATDGTEIGDFVELAARGSF
jgi:HK97 family phage major capsid protein